MKMTLVFSVMFAMVCALQQVKAGGDVVELPLSYDANVVKVNTVVPEVVKVPNSYGYGWGYPGSYGGYGYPGSYGGYGYSGQGYPGYGYPLNYGNNLGWGNNYGWGVPYGYGYEYGYPNGLPNGYGMNYGLYKGKQLFSNQNIDVGIKKMIADATDASYHE